MSSANPLPEEMLSAYLDNELAPHERTAVEEALAKDASLRVLLGDLRRIRAEMKALPGFQLDAQFAQRIREKVQATPVQRPTQWSRERHMRWLVGISAGIACTLLALTWIPRSSRPIAQSRQSVPVPDESLSLEDGSKRRFAFGGGGGDGGRGDEDAASLDSVANVPLTKAAPAMDLALDAAEYSAGASPRMFMYEANDRRSARSHTPVNYSQVKVDAVLRLPSIPADLADRAETIPPQVWQSLWAENAESAPSPKMARGRSDADVRSGTAAAQTKAGSASQRAMADESSGRRGVRGPANLGETDTFYVLEGTRDELQQQWVKWKPLGLSALSVGDPAALAGITLPDAVERAPSLMSENLSLAADTASADAVAIGFAAGDDAGAAGENHSSVAGPTNAMVEPNAPATNPANELARSERFFSPGEAPGLPASGSAVGRAKAEAPPTPKLAQSSTEVKQPEGLTRKRVGTVTPRRYRILIVVPSDSAAQ